MRRLLISWLMLFGHLTFAQGVADSLQLALRSSRNDIDKANTLNALADHFKQSDPKKTLTFAREALSLSQKIKFRQAEGDAHLNLGNANIILGNYPAALSAFSSARAVFESIAPSAKEKTEVQNGLARAYGSIGIVFSEQSNYPRALEFHLKALRLYETLRSKPRMARVYNNIGIVYKAQGDNFRALDYFTKCLKLQEKTGDPTAATTTTNIANIYLAEKDFSSASKYYEKAKALFVKNPDPRGLGELYNNLGYYYLAMGNAKSALESANAAIAEFTKIDDKFGASDAYALIGEIYYERGDYPKALSNTAKSLSLGKMLGVGERIRDSEKKLSEIYQQLNEPELALEHYKKFTSANDSIGNLENVRNSVRAEMNYEFEKKEALQRKEREKRDLVYHEESKRQRQLWMFAALFAALAVGIVFLIQNRRQLKKTLTLQKELAEYEQKALHLQMNPHFVFNCLGSISSFIVQNGTDSAIKYLSKFSKLMRLTLEYSKESLIPIDREIESLQNYLELEQLRFNNVFEFTISKSADIEDDMAIPPLLLQPFVENAIIHGLIPKKDPGLIEISFSIDGQSLICAITDNGIGFNKSQELKENLVSVHKSMALDITRKRLEMMEAYTSKASQVDIREMKDSNGNITGTGVTIRLPIQFTKQA